MDPPSGAETANPERIRVEGWKVENLFGGLSPACDFMDLVQSGNYSVVTLPAHPGEYSVTAFPAQPGDYSCCKQHDLRPLPLLPAQNEFYTRPVAHEGHDLALARPRYRGRLAMFCGVAHLSRPGPKAIIRAEGSHRASRLPSERPRIFPD